MREQMSLWLRRPAVMIAAIVMGIVFAVIVVPELLRVGGVTGATSSVVRLGSVLVVVLTAFALLWFISGPVRRVIDDARRRGNLAYLVRPAMSPSASSPWSAEGAAAILVADSEGVNITRAGHTVLSARWSQLSSWNAEHGNAVTFNVDGTRHRILLLDHRWLYPASRARAALIAAELMTRGESAIAV